MKAESQLIRTIELKDRNGRVVGSKDVVTYQGLLSKAHEEGLKSIKTSLVQTPTKENAQTAIARAEVETHRGIYQGYGDASPASVNPFIVPHLIRMAETRAKARALRDAVNIGVVSFEELDGEASASEVSSLGSDAGNGQRVTRRRSETNGAAQPSTSQGRTAPATPVAASQDPMSEAQRRYLFRLLAGRGLEGEAAHDWLLKELAVTTMADVSRTKAGALIDQILAAPPQDPKINGAARLQR